mgnify:CR=1 FL=1
MYKFLFGFLLSCSAQSVFGEYVPSVPNWGVCGTQDENDGNWNRKYQIDNLTFWSDFGVQKIQVYLFLESFKIIILTVTLTQMMQQ